MNSFIPKTLHLENDSGVEISIPFTVIYDIWGSGQHMWYLNKKQIKTSGVQDSICGT